MIYKPNMTDLLSLGNSFCQFGLIYRTVPKVFKAKVSLFDKSSKKMFWPSCKDKCTKSK